VTTIDFSKCKTKKDVEAVYKKHEEELSITKKAVEDLQKRIRESD
jgi:hypothetical protein